MKDVPIPKIIMQTWKTNDIPNHWKSSPASIKHHMPDWKYILMTDDDNLAFVEKHFPNFLETYNSLEYPIMKADAIRYMWLYIHGGIYLDLDIMIRKDLSPLFKEDGDLYLIKSGNLSSFYTNSFMASKPNDPFWLECIEEIRKPYKFWAIGKHFKVMTKTGPLMVSRTVKKNTHNIVNIPTKAIMACSICDDKPCQLKDSYAINLEGSSWIGNDTRFYNFCLCHWKKIVPIIIVIIAIIIFLIILRRNRKLKS